MSKKSSDEQSQKINSAIFGSNNNTTLTQVVVNVNSPFVNQELLAKQLTVEIKDALENEFSVSDHNILLCYPNKKIDNKTINYSIDEIKKHLEEKGARVYEGGGKSVLPIENVGYSHLSELEFIRKTNCDTVIIFALDEITLSQLTLISHFKISRKLELTDIVIISSEDFKNSDQFLLNGTFKYCSDNNCSVISLDSFGDNEIKSIIDRIVNKKIIQRKNGLLGV
ncbi:hypothetical protein F157LOC_04067 [Pectobacterium brasiliense]|uniref:hypothetical protein n=1 Tax=Pectobacterium brasiliense TaxID=180957 RepID=UPI000CE68AA9|nr:hypothetical protein [Pectobacterium brasiliense]PPE56419.1 hypothetical protein F157LOC_04067 [Pectobacterium brasiliense]